MSFDLFQSIDRTFGYTFLDKRIASAQSKLAEDIESYLNVGLSPEGAQRAARIAIVCIKAIATLVLARYVGQTLLANKLATLVALVCVVETSYVAYYNNPIDSIAQDNGASIAPGGSHEIKGLASRLWLHINR